MDNYLILIQNNPLYSVTAGCALAVFASLVLLIALRSRYRRQLKRLHEELAETRATLRELDDNSHVFQTQLAEISQALDEQQAAQTLLETTIDQLRQKNRRYKALVERLQLARLSIFETMNRIAQERRQLTEALASRQDVPGVGDPRLSARLNRYKKLADSLLVGRMKTFDELNTARQLSRHASEQLVAVQTQQQQEKAARQRQLDKQNLADKALIARLTNQRVQMVDELNTATRMIRQLETRLAQTSELPPNPSSSLQIESVAKPSVAPTLEAEPQPETPLDTPEKLTKPLMAKFMLRLKQPAKPQIDEPADAAPFPPPIAEPTVAPIASASSDETAQSTVDRSWLDDLKGQLNQAQQLPQQAAHHLQTLWRTKDSTVAPLEPAPAPVSEPEAIAPASTTPWVGQIKDMYKKLGFSNKNQT